MKLAPKILLLLLCVTVGVLSVYSVNAIRKASRDLEDDALKNHDLLLQNVIPVFEKSLWELDQDIAKKGMMPLFEGGTVLRTMIYEASGKFYYGLQTKKSAEGTGTSVLEDAEPFEAFKLGDPDKPVKPFSERPAALIAPVQHFAGNTHRLTAALWWKEGETAEPRFMGHAILEFSTDFVAARLAQQRMSVINLAVVLSASILVLTFFFLQKSIISPIGRLMEASLNVAQGKYIKLQVSTSRDEIGLLTNNFNHMVEKIEHNIHTIRALGEASQEIVRAQNPQEVAEKFESFAKKLLDADSVEIWISAVGVVQADATELSRLSDGTRLGISHPALQMVHNSRQANHSYGQETKAASSSKARNYQHALLVPLINANGIIIGMAEIFSNTRKSRFGEEDVGIARGLSVPLATAIENYWHVQAEKDKANMERDLELASAVQDSILCRNIPTSDIFVMDTLYKTASQCGGDWFGIYEMGPNQLMVLFGDVTGHGTPAALMTAVVRGAADLLPTLLAHEPRHLAPGRALGYLNERLVDTGRQTYFMTMVCAWIDFEAKRIYASSAGHTPPALFEKEGGKFKAHFVYPKGGPRLGYQRGAQYETQAFDFLPGHQVMFYTDGIVEGENRQNREYGLKKMKLSFEDHAYLEPKDMLENIMQDAFMYFEGVPPKDDIALMVVKFRETGAMQKKGSEAA